jgi:acyl carrier protein
MRFRSNKTIRQDALNARTRQSDKEFIAACEVAIESAPYALKVRTAIANLANIDSEYVRAQDRFERDLGQFDFWGSLDSIAVVLELEECLGVRISDKDACEILDPERKPETTVADFVRNVVHVVQKNELIKK